MPSRVLKALITTTVLLLAGCQGGSEQASQAPFAPAPVAEAQLRPGLQAAYFLGDFQDVDNMPKSGAGGRQGNPVPNLAASSTQGNLWEASQRELYGVVFSGFLKLDAGSYLFAMNSNDGARVTLGGRRIMDDPLPHPAQIAASAPIAIATAGWYPITVHYFQRRGGATLELFWQPPGQGGRSVIPAAAFAHAPGG